MSQLHPHSAEALPHRRPVSNMWEVRTDGARGYYAQGYLARSHMTLMAGERIEDASLAGLRTKLWDLGFSNLGLQDDNDPQVVEWWA